jgi:hypothetical protein
MANRIQESEIEASNFVDTSSRFAASDVIYYGDNNLITFKTYKRNQREADPSDQFSIVTKGTEFRPDLISVDAYGTPNFWWKILEANGMMDIDEFKTGTNIRVPSVLTIFSS